MPDPRQLQVGDRLRFTSLPEEWSDPDFTVHSDDLAFMHYLVSRRRPCRVARVDEFGTPWIDARIRLADDTLEHHSWGVFETTGWRKVQRRRV